MSRITGADLIIRLLEQQGIECIAGIPGGFNLPLYDALSKSDRIKHILARHEQGAGFIAHGMARTSGKPAVFFATSGPGATNTLTAIADAHLDSVPLICITGQVPLSMIGTDAFQEVDIYGMSIPVTKHNFLVRSIEELTKVIPEAFAIAASGRPGPVLIDIPKDIQVGSIELASMPEAGKAVAPVDPSARLVAEAAAMINNAERPVVMLGGGAARADSVETARELVKAIGAPVTMSLMGLGIVPADDPLSINMLGMHGARYTNMLMDESDFVLAIGVRFDDRATGKLGTFCTKAKIVHIDIDASEMGKLQEVVLGITADAGCTMKALLPHISKKDRSAWLARLHELKSSCSLKMPEEDNPCSSYGIIRCTAEIVGPEAIVTTDVGQHQMRVAQAYPFSRPDRWLTSSGLGTMGFGLPAAIGAAVENPEATVVCFTGDGSFLMNIQELAVAAEENVNVKIVLCNNESLGLVDQQQDLFYGGRFFGSHYKKSPDYRQIAQGFGLEAIRLNESESPLEELRKALTKRGPCLIEVNIAASDKVFPMVAPGAANIDMIGG